MDALIEIVLSISVYTTAIVFTICFCEVVRYLRRMPA